VQLLHNADVLASQYPNTLVPACQKPVSRFNRGVNLHQAPSQLVFDMTFEVIHGCKCLSPPQKMRFAQSAVEFLCREY
jgi:hypothetical protein